VSGIKLPLTISIAGHIVCLAMLIAFMSQHAPQIPEPIARGGIEVDFSAAATHRTAATARRSTAATGIAGGSRAASP